jgi:hypothetical protein
MDNDDLIININNTMLSIDTHILETPNIGDISINSGDIYVYNGSSWNNTSSLTIDTIDLSNITIDPIEFEDCMPDVAKVEDMCRDYPALEKAYENFKTIYKMVHQDWQGRQDAENEPPF